MKFARKLIALGLISTALVTVGCSSTSTDEAVQSSGDMASTISIVASGEAMNFNPLYANDRVSMTVMNAIYNPLYVIEENGDKTFYLAEDIKASEDFLTYTVTLKKDIKWHDGQALTADDIVFTVESMLDEAQAAKGRGGFVLGDKTVEVNKIDDLTVEFKLPEVSSAIEDAIGGLRPIAKHIYEGEADLGKSEKNATPVGNGAYKFKEYKTGEIITLERFEDYYGEKANLETVTYRIIADSNSANIALQNGEVHAKYVQPDEVENVEAKGNVDIVAYDEGMVDNLVFSQRSNDQLKKKEVRKAIAYAINRDEIIQAAYKSEEYADKATSLFAPGTIGFTDEVEKYDQDKEKSKELLKQAGAENLKLKLAYGTHKTQLEATALVIQNNLKDVGIEVELMPMEKSSFFAALLGAETPDFDLALNGYVMGSEPSDYASVFATGGGNNASHYSNPEIDAKFEAALKETDTAKRDAIYKEIQQTIVDELALYPIAYGKSLVAIDKNYDGVEEANPAPIFMFRDLNKLKLK